MSRCGSERDTLGNQLIDREAAANMAVSSEPLASRRACWRARRLDEDFDDCNPALTMAFATGDELCVAVWV